MLRTFANAQRLAILAVALSCSAALASTGRQSHISPLNEHLLDVASHPAGKVQQSSPPPVVCSSYDQFQSELAAMYADRVVERTFRLQYAFAFADVASILEHAHAAVLAADDYLLITFGSYSAGWNGSDGDVEIAMQAEYLTTREQEEYVNARVAEVVDELIAADMTDEEKERRIHDWVIHALEYDTSGEPLGYTAYGALTQGRAVCQGYAGLGYLLLTRAGLEARIVTGQGRGEAHAWNMVRVCGAWYHLDLTWDDPVTPDGEQHAVSYAYFNRSDAEMRLDHTWDGAGLPAAPSSYVAGVCTGDTEPLTWVSSLAAAMDAARSDTRWILLVAGRPTCPYTRNMLDAILQSGAPPVKSLVREHCVVWFCDVDSSTAWYPYGSGLGTFSLPLVCFVDAQEPMRYLGHSTGPQDPDAFHGQLEAIVSGELALLSWYRDKAAAMAAAAAAGRTVLLVAGRDECGNTTYTLNSVLETADPPVKALLRERFVIWYAQVDSSAEWRPYASGLGQYTLPLVCCVVPDAADGVFLDRSTGVQEPSALYSRLVDVAGDPASHVMPVSWATVKALTARRLHVERAPLVPQPGQ